MGGQRARIDHGGDGIRGIVKAVDEFEGERNQECDEEQKVRQIGRHLGAGRVDVDIDAVGDEQQRGGHHSHVDDTRQRMKAALEVWSLSNCGLDRTR